MNPGGSLHHSSIHPSHLGFSKRNGRHCSSTKGASIEAQQNVISLGLQQGSVDTFAFSDWQMVCKQTLATLEVMKWKFGVGALNSQTLEIPTKLVVRVGYEGTL